MTSGPTGPTWIVPGKLEHVSILLRQLKALPRLTGNEEMLYLLVPFARSCYLGTGGCSPEARKGSELPCMCSS